MKKNLLLSFITILTFINCSSDDEGIYKNTSISSKLNLEFDINNQPNVKTISGVNEIPLNSNLGYVQTYSFLNFIEGYSRNSIWLSEKRLTEDISDNDNHLSITISKAFKISNTSDKTYLLHGSNEIGKLSPNEFFIGIEFNVLNINDHESNAYAYYTASENNNLTLKIEVFKNSNKMNIYLEGGACTDDNRSFHSYFIDNPYYDEDVDLNEIKNLNLMLKNIDFFFSNN